MASGIPGSSQEKLLGESGSEGMGRGALVSALEPNTARAHPPWSFPGKKAHGGSGAGGHSSLATLHSFIHSFIHPSSRHPVMQTDICVHITQMHSLICSCVRGGTRLEALKHRPLGGELRGQVAHTAQPGAQGWTQSHSMEWRPWEGPSEA